MQKIMNANAKLALDEPTGQSPGHPTVGSRNRAVRRETKRRVPNAVISALSICGLLLVWCVLTFGGFVPPGYFPSPIELGNEFVSLLKDGYRGTPLHEHLGISLYRTGLGFVLGTLVGVPLGLLTGSSRVLGAMVSPVMAFLRPIPPIAFIPMAVLYFGLGESGKVALIFWTSAIYVHVNAHAGAANLPVGYTRAARSLGLKRWTFFTRVLFPAAVPQIFTGLKVAMSLAWAVVVAAELTGAQSGLGYMIADAALISRIPVVFIGIALIGLVGLCLHQVISLLENLIVHWKGR